MDLRPDSLRFILGLKLRQHRLANHWGLKDVSSKTGLSVSYLSEIEKGRKYPKPDKLIQLAQGLGLTYDEPVSPRAEENLNLVRDLFASPFRQEFPFHLVGIEPEQVAGLVTEAPSKAGALLRTFLEIGRSYDVQVEHFLFAALRSYQQMKRNYFAEIEQAAEAFLAENGWQDRRGPNAEELRRVLEQRHGYRIDRALLASYPELSNLRSVLVDGERLIAIVGGEPDALVVAFDKRTGEEIWRVERDERGNNWSTPVVWENRVRTEIVTAGSDGVRSYDLDGTLLWELYGRPTSEMRRRWEGAGDPDRQSVKPGRTYL